MAEVSREVKGLSQILQALDQLPERVERNIVKAGLRESIKIIGADLGARIVAISRTGKLARSTKLSTSNKYGIPTVTISIGNREAYYAGFVERGTKPRTVKANMWFGRKRHFIVKHPGYTGRFVVKKAFDAQADKSVAFFRAYLMARIAKEWNKLARKGLVK